MIQKAINIGDLDKTYFKFSQQIKYWLQAHLSIGFVEAESGTNGSVGDITIMTSVLINLTETENVIYRVAGKPAYTLKQDSAHLYWLVFKVSMQISSFVVNYFKL